MRGHIEDVREFQCLRFRSFPLIALHELCPDPNVFGADRKYLQYRPKTLRGRMDRWIQPCRQYYSHDEQSDQVKMEREKRVKKEN